MRILIGLIAFACDSAARGPHLSTTGLVRRSRLIAVMQGAHRKPAFLSKRPDCPIGKKGTIQPPRGQRGSTTADVNRHD